MPGGFQSMLRLRAYLSLMAKQMYQFTHQDQSNAPKIISHRRGSINLRTVDSGGIGAGGVKM